MKEKVELNTVAEVLQQEGIEPETIERVVSGLRRAAAEESAAREEGKAPAEKKQHVIVLSDPDGVIPQGKELVGWVVQIPEMESVLTVMDKVHRAAYDFNMSRRGRKNPVSTVGEAMEAVQTKFFKDQKLSVKTKIPVFACITDNRIPAGEEEKE